MKKLTLFLICLLLIGSQIVNAQVRSISGTVTSAEDGSSIPGVSIIVKGTTLGTITNIDGVYTIDVPSDAQAIIFSFVGMKSVEKPISGLVVSAALEADILGLDEVMVIAYGSSKKGAFTGSAAQVNSDKIELRPVTNITKAIEGAAPGIQVTAGDGQPGSGQSIRVRGFGSYSASNDPLYVVDGVPFSGSISSINTNDIESLTVLKDAASTALYGNKAANGVVLMTTKKGKSGKGQLSVNISNGVVTRSQPEYELLGPDDYYPIMWESYRNSLTSTGTDLTTANQKATTDIINHLRYNPYNVPNDNIVGTDGKLNPGAKLIYADDLDWLGAIMRTGKRQNYDISFQGGDSKSDYYASLGYLDEKGYIVNSDFQRISARANINFKATDWFKTGLNISGTTSKAQQAQTAGSSSFVNPIRFTRQMGPIYPIHEHDATTGAYILDDNGEKKYDLNDNRPSGASTGRHIVAEIEMNKDDDEITSLGAKSYGEITFMPGLVLTLNASIDQRHWYESGFENKLVGDGAPGGRANRNYYRRTVKNYNQLLNYTKSVENHNFKALLAHESYDYTNNVFNGYRTQIIADGNTELINFVTTTGLDSYTDTYRSEGYFGRLDYDYNGKYFISGSYRKDGSSKFSENNRWGDFWSISGAWRLDQESFIQDLTWIDMLKFRGSYGEVGNDAGIGFYAYQALYALDWNNQSESGYVQDKLQADALVWESNNSFDAGLEFGLFNRLFGTIEFYHKISENLLFGVPLPVSSGIDEQDKNVGTLYNQGIELSISYDLIDQNDFKWNINANATTLHNEFTKLPGDTPEKPAEIINGSKKLMKGHSIYDYWLKEWAGVDSNDGAALYRADSYSPDDSNIRMMGGDTLTTDQNNARFFYAGTAIPDLYGAVTNTFTYKDFELGFMFTYQIGGEVLDYNYQSVMSPGSYGSSKSLDILNRWQKPGDVTDIPRMDVGEVTNFNATSSRWLTDASFLNLRQINFSYNIPKNAVSRLGMSSARVYLSGENLWLLNARKGMNVQQNFSGTTSNVYTPSRVITLGLNVKF